MHVIKANINGNPNVGLFGFDTGEFILIGERLKKNQKKLFEEVLGKPILKARIAGTTMTGVFLAKNKNALLIPNIILDTEEKVLKENNIDYKIIKSDITCFGNTIACNDFGAIISTEFSDHDAKIIGEALKVPVKKLDIAGLTTPGALIVINKENAIIHKDASSEEIKIIEEILNVKCHPATVNLGSPHLNAGILNSTKGFIIGDQSGGPEILNIDEVLGYMEDQE